MEIRTDFTALVLPSASELQQAAERARIAAEAAQTAPRRVPRLLPFARRRATTSATRDAAAH